MNVLERYQRFSMLGPIVPFATANVIVPGIPKAWERARRDGRRSKKEYFLSDDLETWYARIRSRWNEWLFANLQYRDRFPYDGPISIAVNAYLPVPAGWREWRKIAAAAGRLPCERGFDFDNVIKGIGDALNRRTWKDDRRIFGIHAPCGKWWTVCDDSRLDIEILFYPEITRANYSGLSIVKGGT